jgi:hypothetical protein
LVNEWLRRAADACIGSVNGLKDIQIKLFSAWNTHIKTVALDCFVNVLRVNGQNLLRALERRIIQRGAVDGAKNRLLLFSQRVGRGVWP